MSEFFAWAFAAVLVLLLIAWLGPYLVNWFLRRLMNSMYKAVREYEERRNERHAQIQAALEPLRSRVTPSADSAATESSQPPPPGSPQ